MHKAPVKIPVFLPSLVDMNSDSRLPEPVLSRSSLARQSNSGTFIIGLFFPFHLSLKTKKHKTNEIPLKKRDSGVNQKRRKANKNLRYARLV